MARKPNYNFERKERERLKAEKAEERAKAKSERKTEVGTAQPDQPPADKADGH